MHVWRAGAPFLNAKNTCQDDAVEPYNNTCLYAVEHMSQVEAMEHMSHDDAIEPHLIACKKDSIRRCFLSHVCNDVHAVDSVGA